MSYLRDEVTGAVTEEHQHGQQPLGFLCVIVQTLQKEFQPSLWSQLTDESPQFGQQIIQISET